MPRKTSFCNRALLRSDVKRYWPLLFMYVLVWVVILPLQLVQTGRYQTLEPLVQAQLHNAICSALYASVVMALISGCLFAMAVWSYLMSARTVGLMHALPVTRTQAFFSHTLSAMGMLTAGNVLVFLVSVLCSAGRGFVDWATLGAWLLLTELMCLFFFALASLCAVVTGWLLAVPVLYGAVNVVALLLYLVVRAVAQLFYYGYAGSGEVPQGIRCLTPVMRIWNSLNDGAGEWITAQGPDYERQVFLQALAPKSFIVCAVYAAVGIALLALVWWLYKKRPSETGGDAMAFRWLRPIARWTIGLCGGWGLGLFLHYTIFVDSGFVNLLVCQLIMGVICFFAAQMLLQKKFRIFNKRWWIETAALVLVLAAVMGGVKLDITGYQTRVPDAGRVKAVSFSCAGAHFSSEDTGAAEEIIALHRAIIDQYQETGLTIDSDVTLESGAELQYRWIYLTYTLKNGTKLERSYGTPVLEGSDVHRLLTQLVNRTDSRESLIGIDSLARYGGVNAVISGYVRRYDTDEVAELTRQQAQDLASLALADAANSSGPLDPRSDDFYSYAKGYDMDIQLRVVIDRETSTTVPLNVPAFALRMQKFIDGLEFQVDGSSGETTKAVDEILYD